MGDVVILNTETKLDVTPARVLEGATKIGLSEIVVIGFTDAGEFYFAASKTSAPDILWALERAKLRLMSFLKP